MKSDSKKFSNIINTGDYQSTKEEGVKGLLLVLGYFGIFLIVISVITLLPLLMLFFYPEESNEYYYFVIPGFIAMVLGLGLTMIIFRKKQEKLTAIEDLVLVIGVWVLAIVFAAIPFMFYGYDFTQAMFEATSGYTSTGLSIINWATSLTETSTGVTDVTSHMLFFHRALIELVGGIGLVLIVSSAISERSGLNLYLLEGHNDKLLPNLAKSAQLIFNIYFSYIVLGAVLYILVGVTPYDAICHAMTAVATGGFSTKANNINSLVQEVSVNGEWRGIMVELISELLMLLGGTNFVIHYSLFRRKFKVLRHFEFVVFFAILVLVWPFMIVGMTQYYGGDFLSGLRYGTFEMISGMSTCGFQSVDSYLQHDLIINGVNTTILAPTYVLFLLGLLMCIGSQNGSTSGAIKQNRIALLFMDIWWRMKASIGKPEQVHVPTTYKFGVKTKVTPDEVTEAETFIGIYMAILILATTLVSAITYGMNIVPEVGSRTTPFTFTECFFEISSCLGTVGLGCGITCYTTNAAILWIEIAVMMLGRLEIFCYFTLGGKMIHYLKHYKYMYNGQTKDNSKKFAKIGPRED